MIRADNVQIKRTFLNYCSPILHNCYPLGVDVQHLRSFRSVVATGSVRAAADTLGFSPSAVSQQLAQLQRDAGVPLLNRVGRGVEPTTAGHALAERIDVLLGEFSDLDGFVRGLREGRSRVVNVSYFPSLGTTWLPRIVGPLVTEFPDVRIDLAVTDLFDPGRRPRPDVQLIVVPPAFPAPEAYELHPLADDPYVVALPPGHPLAGRTHVPLRELADEPWIDNDFAQGWCRRVAVDACAAAGFQPAYRIATHDYPAALALVAAGVGISVMPSLGALDRPAGVEVRPLVQPTPVRAVGALILREAADLPVVRRALALARAAARTGR